MENYSDLQRKHINYAVNGKIMLCTGIVLFAAILTIICFRNYARTFHRNRRRRYISRRAQHLLFFSTASPTTVVSEGLDPSVFKRIPTFIYSTKASHCPPLECAVCLSEFENDEKVRVLPKCNHAFHVDCIDMWFHTHSNCPLCRTPIQADIPVNPPKRSEQTIVPVAEPAGLEPAEEDIEMNSSSASSSSSSSSPSSLKLESCPMKTLELVEVGILVEVPLPAGEDRLTGVADVGSGNRILSLKRIWRVE